MTPLLSTVVLTGGAQASTGAADLLPLNENAITLQPQTKTLIAIEQDINTSFKAAQTPEQDTLDLSQLPIIREFVDSKGNFGLQMASSMSVNVVTTMDGYGLGINHKF